MRSAGAGWRELEAESLSYELVSDVYERLAQAKTGLDLVRELPTVTRAGLELVKELKGAGCGKERDE